MLKPGQHLFEFQLFKPEIGFRRIQLSHPGSLHVKRKIRMGFDGSQGLAHLRQVIMLRQRVLRPLRFDLLQMGVGVLNAPVGGDDIRRPLLPDPRHPGDIVRAVAHQRLDVDELLRRHLVALQHIRRVIVLDLGPGPFGFGNTDLHLLRGQLQKIPIPGDNADLHAGSLRPHGKCP